MDAALEPTGALLVFVGVKLASPTIGIELHRKRPSDALIYAITILGIVAGSLLVGVAIGFAATLIRLGWDVLHVRIDHHETEEEHHITLSGIATFLHLPRIARALERAPSGKRVVVKTEELHYLDPHVKEQLEHWRAERGVAFAA